MERSKVWALAVIGGTVTDDFATNEYDGYLRVLTTRWSGNTQDNCIYVLNQDMEIVGKSRRPGRGRKYLFCKVYGNTGYFVTYRQVDPLFSVDFTDPENPKILGRAERLPDFRNICTFTERTVCLGSDGDRPGYGHTARGALSFRCLTYQILLGCERNQQEDHREYRLFLPGNITIRRLTVSPQKNVIGFVTTSYGNRGGSNSSYFVFSYDDHNGFKNAMTYSAQNGVSSEFENSRGVYIGDTFYIANSDAVLGLDMKNGYEKTGELRD